MSLPYYSNATTWGGVQPIDAWVEHPFEDQNDLVTKEYKIKCSCRNSVYVVPDYSDTMADAATAKLNELPFAADANAYFLGDDNFSSGEADTTTFTRTFGAVPQVRNLSEKSFTYTFPEKRRWWYNRSAQTIINFLGNWTKPIPTHSIRNALNITTAAKYTYTYYYRTDKGLGLKPSTLFTINQNGLTSGSYAYSGTTYYPYVAASTNCGYVSNRTTAGVSWPGTNPTRSSYETYVSRGTYLMAESIIRHYKGNLFYRRDIQVKAK